MRISKPKLNTPKCREVILYVLNKLNHKEIDEETLCNILYFIDFNYYEKHEEQLMGFTYIKEKHE